MYPYIRGLCASGQAESKLQQCLPRLLAESMCKAGPRHIPYFIAKTTLSPRRLLRTDCNLEVALSERRAVIWEREVLLHNCCEFACMGSRWQPSRMEMLTWHCC